MSSGGGNRYERARKALDEGFSHADASVERLRELVDDWNSVARDALATRSYSPNRFVPDVLAFWLNTLDALTCRPNGGTAPTKPEKPTNDPAEDPDTIIPRLRADVLLTFDIMSEMAGPVELELGSGTLSVDDVTNLDPVDESSNEPIDKDNVRVRILDKALVVTLVSLKDVSPGVYAGSVTISGFGEAPKQRTFAIVGQCLDELFWVGTPFL
jgi:hypothetical protein